MLRIRQRTRAVPGFPERLCSPMLAHTARDWRGYAAHTPRLFLLSIRYRQP